MQKRKGQYGYRDSNRKIWLMVTTVFVSAIILQVLVRNLAHNQAAENILTVMAILTVLPMANMASPLIAAWNYKTPDRGFYDKVTPYEDGFTILYDLIVTTKDQIIPIDAAAVHPIGVFAYCPSQKVDTEKAQREMEKLFLSDGLDSHILLLNSEHEFFMCLDRLEPASECDNSQMAERTAALLKNISM